MRRWYGVGLVSVAVTKGLERRALSLTKLRSAIGAGRSQKRSGRAWGSRAFRLRETLRSSATAVLSFCCCTLRLTVYVGARGC